ncbi:co-chaperone GroES [Candidatus Nardonella dryophthoridicola]|uniref:Co-chaperonin GroES n=1 Tax=endosymbiont of Metamasius hemipterus TaxID=204627 RepID=A0ABT0TW91_9GAMM|nr:co-chaperone GroES [Candidatus Nardonella dryophthoridicola]MCM0158257.1 co-chaperone GroES [endosymbiont of Metamasius hemipterus]
MKNIHLLYDKILVKRIEGESKSSGGIVLTGSNKSNRGEVLAIGKGKLLENGNLIPLEVKIGDIIIFNDGYNIKTEKINDKEVLIMSENDILAIIN